MNWKLIGYLLGALALVLSVAMLPPLGIAAFGEATPEIAARASRAFASAIAVSALLGGTMVWFARRHAKDRLYAEDGFAIAACGWVFLSVLGALPFYLCRDLSLPADLAAANAVGSTPGRSLSWIDAWFESTSGFTTTGASVFGTPRGEGGLGAIEALPASLLFWRSLTHWIGGMGIVVLCLAILPALRAGGYQMFSAEVPGPTAERLRPRIRQTAAVLWGVYLLLTVAQTALLWLGDMPLFDALCHTFGTMATGGFSTKDASIGHYAATGHPFALYYESVIAVFMFLAGCNFLFHYRALRGDLTEYGESGEFRFFAAVLAGATGVIALALVGGAVYPDAAWATTFRRAVFQTLSITTTTGFVTADFDVWPGVCRGLLLTLMFFGGCAGSTGSGLKQVRIVIMLKYIYRELACLLRPQRINPIRCGTAVVEDRTVRSIVSLVFLYMTIFVIGTLLVLACLDASPPPAPGAGGDATLVTAASSVAATLNNIGPGFSSVGPTRNYGWMPLPAKFVLSVCMLMGRLEVFALIVTVMPSAWRR